MIVGVPLAFRSFDVSRVDDGVNTSLVSVLVVRFRTKDLADASDAWGMDMGFMIRHATLQPSATERLTMDKV